MRLLSLTIFVLSIVAGSVLLQGSSQSDEAAIRATYAAWSAGVKTRNLDAIMSLYAPNIYMFDATPPRAFVGAAAVRKDYEGFFAAFPAITEQVADLHVQSDGTLAFTRGIDTWTLTAKDGSKTTIVFRFTDDFEKIGGSWKVVQEHVSVPVDLETNKPDLMSKP